MIRTLFLAICVAHGWAAEGGEAASGNKTGVQGVQDGVATVEKSSFDPNVALGIMLLIVMGIMGAILLLYRIALSSIRTARALTTMESVNQAYWKTSNTIWSACKKHLIYAPLIRTRHHSEIWLAKGWSIGVLPTRFQSLFIAVLVAVNVYYCVLGIPWSQAGSSAMLSALRNRTGTIAVINLLPLAMFAGRTNVLIPVLNIPYDTFNMIHRWLGRIIVAQAIVHTVAHLVKAVNAGGWASVARSFQIYGSTPQTGLIAVIGFVVIVVSSMTIFRRAFYEFWLHLHIALIIMITVALSYHLAGLPVSSFILFFIITWASDRIQRVLVMVYRNVGAGGTKALIEHLPGGAIRVKIAMARPWTFKPGQHMFITIPSIGLWTSHPFSLAWSEPSYGNGILTISDPLGLDPEKGTHDSFATKSLKSSTGIHIRPINSRETTQSTIFARTGKATMTAIIRKRDGFTSKLWDRVAKTPNGRFTTQAYIEGPYGGYQSLDSYGTVVLFAGGIGITHQVPYLKALLEGHAKSTVACRRLLLVWIIQSSEHLEWIRPFMTQILAMEGRRQVLRIQIYVTQPRGPGDIQSPSDTVQMFPGRPDVEKIVAQEARVQIGAMAVSVCGPGYLGDLVRSAVRRRQGESSVDLIEEAFSW